MRSRPREVEDKYRQLDERLIYRAAACQQAGPTARLHNSRRQGVREIKRGELYYADLCPVVGSEQGGIRPVLIVQNNIGNQFSPTVIAAAVTTRKREKLQPTQVALGAAHGLRPSLVLLEQMRTLDRIRLRAYIGRVDEKTMRAVDQALAVSVGIDCGSTGG